MSSKEDDVGILSWIRLYSASLLVVAEISPFLHPDMPAQEVPSHWHW